MKVKGTTFGQVQINVTGQPSIVIKGEDEYEWATMKEYKPYKKAVEALTGPRRVGTPKLKVVDSSFPGHPKLDPREVTRAVIEPAAVQPPPVTAADVEEAQSAYDEAGEELAKAKEVHAKAKAELEELPPDAHHKTRSAAENRHQKAAEALGVAQETYVRAQETFKKIMSMR